MPPHFRLKQAPPGHFLPNDEEPAIPEDVYDVPPPTLTEKHCDDERGVVGRGAQEIYDIPASLQPGAHPGQDVYDFPRDREDRGEEGREHNIYDIPPQVLWSRKSRKGNVNVVALLSQNQTKRSEAELETLLWKPWRLTLTRTGAVWSGLVTSLVGRPSISLPASSIRPHSVTLPLLGGSGPGLPL